MFGNAFYDSYLMFQQAALKGFSVFIWHLFSFSFIFSEILFFSVFFFQTGFTYFKERHFCSSSFHFFSHVSLCWVLRREGRRELQKFGLVCRMYSLPFTSVLFSAAQLSVLPSACFENQASPI